MKLARLQEITAKVRRLQTMADAEVFRHGRDVQAPPSEDLLRAVEYTKLCVHVLALLEAERVEVVGDNNWLGGGF